MFIDQDKVCPIEKQKVYTHSMPAYYSETTISGRSHDLVVGDNDEEFFELLLSNLQHYGGALSS